MKAIGKNCIHIKPKVNKIIIDEISNQSKNEVATVSIKTQTHDSVFLIKFNAIVLKIFGLQKLGWAKGEMVTINKIYKAFSLITIYSVVITMVWWRYFSEGKPLFEIESPMPLKVTTALQYFSAAIGSFVAAIQNAIVCPGISLKIFRSLRDIDNSLQMKSDRFKYFKLGVILLHIFYFLIYFILILCFLLWPRVPIAQACIYYLSCVIDLGVIAFSSEMCIVARRFELLNHRLKNVEVKQCAMASKSNITHPVEFNLKGGILTMMWGHNNYEDISTVSLVEPEIPVKQIANFLAIYNKLADVIDDMNKAYGILILISSINTFVGFLAAINVSILLDKMENTNQRVLAIWNLVAWCVHQFLVVICYTTSCEIMQTQNSKIIVTVNKLLVVSEIESEEADLLERFLRLLIQRDLNIMAHNFFVVDYSFVYSLVGTLVSYTIILKQMTQGYL